MGSMMVGMVDSLNIPEEQFMNNKPAWLGDEPQLADKVEYTKDCEVLVIGAGQAGTAAALRCAEEGLNTICCEVQTWEEYDNYACDLTTYNSKFFLDKGAEKYDPMDIFTEYMVKALGHANQKIVKDYATRSGEALDWMLAELDPDYVAKYAHAVNYKGNKHFQNPCSHSYYYVGMTQWRDTGTDTNTNNNMWPYTVRLLQQKAVEKGCEYIYGAQGLTLVHENGKVTGAIFTDIDGKYFQVNADAVIVAAGDFGGNPDMRLKAQLKGDETPEQIERMKEEIKLECEADKEKVIASGGLYILGTERHESRRIDNQLRGRAGRQGDPGTSKFFLSMEDDLMRIFGSERMSAMLQKLGLPEGEPLVHPWISKALEKAQQKVEERNFDIRKNLLKYDNVMNDQRKVIYDQRKELMKTSDVSETVAEMRDEYLNDVLAPYLQQSLTPKEWPLNELQQEIWRVTGFVLPVDKWAEEPEMDAETMSGKIIEVIEQNIVEKNRGVPEELVRLVEKNILLQVMDQLWKEHIATLDYMRHTIVLRAYGQKDPLNEYKKEAFNMFSDMLDLLREKVTFLTCRAQIQNSSEEDLRLRESNTRMQAIHESPESLVGGNAGAPAEEKEKAVPFQYAKTTVDPNDPATWGKVSRNDPCPCGSGKKYKHCHGQILN